MGLESLETLTKIKYIFNDSQEYGMIYNWGHIKKIYQKNATYFLYSYYICFLSSLNFSYSVQRIRVFIFFCQSTIYVAFINETALVPLYIFLLFVLTGLYPRIITGGEVKISVLRCILRTAVEFRRDVFALCHYSKYVSTLMLEDMFTNDMHPPYNHLSVYCISTCIDYFIVWL